MMDLSAFGTSYGGVCVIEENALMGGGEPSRCVQRKKEALSQLEMLTGRFNSGTSSSTTLTQVLLFSFSHSRHSDQGNALNGCEVSI